MVAMAIQRSAMDRQEGQLDMFRTKRPLPYNPVMLQVGQVSQAISTDNRIRAY